MVVSVEATALLRCLRTIDLCLVTRLSNSLWVPSTRVPEEQRPELHLSGGVKSHNCSCCVCRLVLFVSSVQSVKVVFNQSSYTLSSESSFSECGFQ